MMQVGRDHWRPGSMPKARPALELCSVTQSPYEHQSPEAEVAFLSDSKLDF